MSVYAKNNRLAERIEAAYHPICSIFSTSISETHVLLELFARDHQRPADLARAIGWATTSFPPVLNRLIQRGWIERQVNPTDRRSVVISLTPRAQAFGVGVLEQAARIEAELSEYAARVFSEI